MARGTGAQHESHVAALTDAAVRVLEHEGLPGLTFRNVAAEAEVSAGRVQHYFGHRQGLAAATFRRVQERVAEDVRASLHEAGTSTPHEIIGATLRVLIPTTARERAFLRVADVVEQHAFTDADLAEELREGRRGLVGFIAQQMTVAEAARSSGQVNEAFTDDQARAVAITLLATAEGLSSLVLTGAVSGDEAQQLLTVEVERVFP